MKVAKKPAMTCQSMWQWNAQTRAGSSSAKVLGGWKEAGDTYLGCPL